MSVGEFQYESYWYVGEYIVDGYGTYIPEGNGAFFKTKAKEVCSYVGQVKNGQCHGYGIMWHDEGQCHEGYFNKGLHEGPGKLTFVDGMVVEGDCIDGNFDGWCKITASDGSIYECECHDKQVKGYALIHYSNGTIYEGFVESSKNKRIVQDGIQLKREHEGSVLSIKKHGHGILTFPNGCIMDGEWKEDEFIIPLIDSYDHTKEVGLRHRKNVQITG